jgi:hypothetical protein
VGAVDPEDFQVHEACQRRDIGEVGVVVEVELPETGEVLQRRHVRDEISVEVERVRISV